MSDFGDAIISRLPKHSVLHNTNHPMNRIIHNTVGEWLQNFYDADWFSQFFLNTATGKWLDLHGKQYNIIRRIDENDDSFRKRIVYEVLGILTLQYLTEVYGVELYTNVEEFDPADNTLVSDNPYLNTNGFMVITDDATKEVLKSKFVLDTKIRFLGDD